MPYRRSGTGGYVTKAELAATKEELEEAKAKLEELEKGLPPSEDPDDPDLVSVFENLLATP